MQQKTGEMLPGRTLSAAALLLVAVLADANEAESSCRPDRFPAMTDTEIVSARAYEAGMVKDEDRPFPPTLVPNHCRITGVIRPAAESEINFQVWLPDEGWNGKLIGVGNGGYGGRIFQQGGLAEAVQRGYAAVSTDTGHSGSAIDTGWAYQNIEKIIDWGYRAVHLMTVTAKSIVETFYGNPAEKSYFISCSNGGRQGLMAAQRYPNDYDGIVVGAPAHDFTGLITAFAWNYLAQNGNADAVIPPSFAGRISTAVENQCDSLDGVRDGLVSDPGTCSVDFSGLLCGDPQNEDCLSESQLTALESIYRGPINSSGHQLYSGWPVGGESGTYPGSGWEVWMLGDAPHQRDYVEGFFRDFLARGRDWSIGQFDFDRDPMEAEEALGEIVNATSPDLRAFADNGGKLIVYHGWSDEAVPATGTIEYFDELGRFLGPEKVDQFARLFLVPGMQHCAGGHGPSLFNNLTAPSMPRDPSRDIGAALEAWVEDGVAPQSLIAVEPDNLFESVFDLSKAAPGRTHLLCPYPQRAGLRGARFNQNNASSFLCED